MEQSFCFPAYLVSSRGYSGCGALKWSVHAHRVDFVHPCVCLNAMTLVVLTNREQLYAMDARAAAGNARAAVSRSVRHSVVRRVTAAADEPSEAPGSIGYPGRGGKP